MATYAHNTETIAAEGTRAAPGRRSVFGAAALLALATPARASDYAPDADLIALCAQFNNLEQEFQATDFDADPATPQGNRVSEQQRRIHADQRDLVDQICGMPIRTREGATALARALASHDLELFGNACAGRPINQRLAGALVGGLIGWPA